MIQYKPVASRYAVQSVKGMAGTSLIDITKKYKLMSKEEMIAKLITLALAIEDKTEKCVFVDYHGHVNWVEVRIAESKKHYNNWLDEFRVYFGESDFLNVFNKVYESLNKYLL